MSISQWTFVSFPSFRNLVHVHEFVFSVLLSMYLGEELLNPVMTLGGTTPPLSTVTMPGTLPAGFHAVHVLIMFVTVSLSNAFIKGPE